MEFKTQIQLFINSLIFFIASFTIAYLPFQFFPIIFAKLFGIYYEVHGLRVLFPEAINEGKWEALPIVLIYGTAPIISYLLTLYIRKAIFRKFIRQNSNLKLFFIWLTLHQENLFWGSIISGIVTSGGFAYFLNWLFIPEIIQWILAFVGLSIFLNLKTFILASFLELSPSSENISNDNQLSFKLLYMILPTFLGVIFLIEIGWPSNQLHDTILLLPIFVPIISTLPFYKIENTNICGNKSFIQKGSYYSLALITYLVLFFYIWNK